MANPKKRTTIVTHMMIYEKCDELIQTGIEKDEAFRTVADLWDYSASTIERIYYDSSIHIASDDLPNELN